MADEGLRERLIAIREDAERIANALAALVMPEPIAVPVDVGIEEEVATLRAFLRLRRIRARFFAEALFADPAWDILLDLRLAELEGRRVAVSSLCIAAAVPATTALRWIGLMTETGLLTRLPDPRDGRRVFVRLSSQGSAAMSKFATIAVAVWRESTHA